MSFNIKNSFVSRSIVEDNQEKRINDEEIKEEVIQEKYDPRTLFERLQEQKALKEEKFAEEARFSNHIKKMDAEDIEYFKTLSDEKEKLEFQQKVKDRLELEEFRQAVGTVRTENVIDSIKVKPVIKKLPIKSNKKESIKGTLLIKKKKREEDKDEKEEERADKKQKIEEPKKVEALKKAEEPKKVNNPLSLLSAYDDISSSEEE